MGCTSEHTLSDVLYSCADLPVGGLMTVFIARKDKTTVAFAIDDETTVESITFDEPTIDIVKLEFNNKDAFTSFTDVKTVDPTGTIQTIPTITIEFPKMNKEKRDEMNELCNAGLELLGFIKTAAGTQHLVGMDFGLFGSTVTGQTGTGRSEKNVYQLTLSGDETNLALDLTDAVWALLVADWELEDLP